MNNHRKKIWQKTIKDLKNESLLRKQKKQRITQDTQKQEKEKLLNILKKIKEQNIQDPLKTIKEQNYNKKQLKIKELHRLYGSKSMNKKIITKINKTYIQSICKQPTTQKVNN